MRTLGERALFAKQMVLSSMCFDYTYLRKLENLVVGAWLPKNYGALGVLAQFGRAYALQA